MICMGEAGSSDLYGQELGSDLYGSLYADLYGSLYADLHRLEDPKFQIGPLSYVL